MRATGDHYLWSSVQGLPGDLVSEEPYPAVGVLFRWLGSHGFFAGAAPPPEQKEGAWPRAEEAWLSSGWERGGGTFLRPMST